MRAQRLNVRQRVRVASSLTAALADGLSEQPAGYFGAICDRETKRRFWAAAEFVSTLLVSNLQQPAIDFFAHVGASGKNVDTNIAVFNRGRDFPLYQNAIIDG